MTDFRALCAELVAWAEKTSAHYYSSPGVLIRARAALAEADEPAEPSDEAKAKPTVMEIVQLADEIEAAELGQIDLVRAALARWGTSNERLPEAVQQALIKAECALSDIAEGAPMSNEGDPLQWAERRCADTLAIIRPWMKQYRLRTSEWPPISAHTLPLPSGEVE